MRTPVTYYGGKQNLASKIIQLIPGHVLYCEPFCGGAAVFFAKGASDVEVINDTNRELINFYRVVQSDYVSLSKEIRISLHSRDMHRKASVIYNNPDLFNEIKRAWAFWILATQSFSAQIDGTWGYERTNNTTPKKVQNRIQEFTEELAIRLQNVQVECADALRIIRSRDFKDAFFYCDPPYYNSDCAHYDGYSLSDYRELLETLASIKGRFLLSSYPSDILAEFTEQHGWHQLSIDQVVSVANDANTKKGKKIKTEVMTANYDLNNVVQDGGTLPIQFV